ncbi:MAG: hypothetical protein K2M84_01780 [Anaeroplasmataceae bacterium]|nr:hypothetical protein [Anaeroplasmataceae bacterium]
MKKMYLYGLLCIIGLFLCGCNQTSSEEPQKPIELESEYHETTTQENAESEELEPESCEMTTGLHGEFSISYIWIVLDRNFPHKTLTVEDFPGLEIEELRWDTEKIYKKYLEEGNFPDYFSQQYNLILKNKETSNYIEAKEYIKELNYDFIKSVSLFGVMY